MRSFLAQIIFVHSLALSGQVISTNIEGSIFNKYCFIISVAERQFYKDTSFKQKTEQLANYDKAFTEFSGFSDHIYNAFTTAIEVKDRTRVKKYLNLMFSNGSEWGEIVNKEIAKYLGSDLNATFSEYKKTRLLYLKKNLSEEYLQLSKMFEKDQTFRSLQKFFRGYCCDGLWWKRHVWISGIPLKEWQLQRFISVIKP